MIGAAKHDVSKQRWAIAVFGYGLGLLGLVYLVFQIADPPNVPAVTDFRRDLVGAIAADHGLSPYQQLGDLQEEIPGLMIPESAAEYWVAHSPFSIAVARLFIVLGGESAEQLFWWVVVASSLVLLTYFPASAKSGMPGRMGLAGALALTVGMGDDLVWLQGAAPLALGLGMGLVLARRHKRGLAFIVLGLCIAWRPWCAPIALLLPNSDRPTRDLLWASGVGLGLTLVVLPFLGGVDSLFDWLGHALPASTSAYIDFEWNLSLAARSLGAFGSTVAGVLVIALIRLRHRWQSSPLTTTQGAAAMLILLPLVWTWYWVCLYPLLLEGRDHGQVWVLVGSLLMLNAPLVGMNSQIVRLASVLAALGLALLSRFTLTRASQVAGHGS